MWTVLILLVTFFFICVISWYIKWRRCMQHLDKYPSPPRVFMLGNALDFIPPVDFISKFDEYTKLYGDVVALYFGPFISKLLISNYNLLEKIFNSQTNLNKGIEYKFFSKWLGNGLLISDGDRRWKSHRKLFSSSFHVQIFQDFLSVFETNTQLLVTNLEKELGKSSFNIKPYIQLCSLDIICEAAMGTSIHAQENSDSDYVNSVKLMCEMFIMRSFTLTLRYNFLYKFSKLYTEEKRALEILHGHTKAVIQRRKKELQQKSHHEFVPDDVGRKKKLTLLDLVIEKSADVSTLTDEAIREEIDTFMFAGHDTSATALTFTIFCLSENIEVQDKVMEEINDIFADDMNRAVTLQDVAKMKYMDAVIKEALRIYPPVPYYSRRVSEEFEFEGKIIPEGTSLLLNIYGLHHNSEYFPDPEKFLPERFLKDNDGEKFPYAYVPFSAGPRNCIGQKFAMLEIKSILSILLRRYKFLPSIPRHTLSLSAETVLTTKNGVRICIAKRNL